MTAFFEMAGFELKKIFLRRGTWIALVLSVSAVILIPLSMIIGSSFVGGEIFESRYQSMVTNRAYAKALSGRAVDAGLLREMKAAWEKVPDEENYQLTKEYEQFGRPYGKIFNIMSGVYRDIDTTNFRTELTDEKIDGFYDARMAQIEDGINGLPISDRTKGNLISNATGIDTPWVFEYTDGYVNLISYLSPVGTVCSLAIAVCLAQMFAGEYTTKASQLILTSRHGKGKITVAKLFTGLAFAFGLSLALALLELIACAVIFGLEGGASPLDLMAYYPGLPYGLSMLQTVFATSCVSILAGILTGAFTMLLSSKFNSPFGVIIVVWLVLVIPVMIGIPIDNMIIYYVYQLLPTNMMSQWSAVGLPYEIFGFGIPPYVFMPLFSAAATAVLLPFAFKAFKHHQMQG